MTVRPRRSVLYMPGSNARALEKGRDLPADGLIIDLEDAVALEAKEAARAIVSDNLRKGAALNAIQIAECLVNRKLITAKRKAA